MKRIVLGVQYDGTPWRGWQTQPGGGTVQDTLQDALRKFTLTDIVTTCAGRTDAGVHALEQVVHFDTGLDRELFSWVRGVNAFLPPSIAVRWSCEVPSTAPDDFHARFSAVARTYHYVIYNHPVRSPLLAGKAGWVFRPLQVEPMREAARHLLGMHDFSSFRAAECQAKSPVKTMHDIRIERQGDILVVTLCANAFLHHMVRNIVGSLIVIGNGNQPPSWMKEILECRDRSRAAPTFMPDGLYLARIDYDAKWALPHDAVNPLPWAPATLPAHA
ncbi:tRNA pseudouridine(38-40) synthase TruA [Noviherbaspirillum sp. UKPF54]|uniref:tRNA pseudouridine(38-40) synthase TruA n=1 Tax=Noviherbaspirillum sp. UKPF54 TaxID=2601898 RepID=UPI0011B1840F|nr:tRNA pseudouridine(38-40) synthase TruA [Noviherbaspirillum sp. UKPF54]QDZ28294.1 tRNA pseudouridine(38-40) synthase TruA [Noviherbaspirillum sp. UKPF54]